VWGANGSDDTYDCSSFTKFVYKSIGIYIPRTSIRQSKYGKFVKRDELKRGDLIFFDTSKEHKGFVNHVGIYLGNNRFIHASSAKHKVIITKLEKNFYSRRYKGARRPSS
jgi:cell wall-associated NlpC family hydrolase